MPSRVHLGWTEIDLKMECICDGPTLTSKCKFGPRSTLKMQIWPEINPLSALNLTTLRHCAQSAPAPWLLSLATGLGRFSSVQMTAAPKNPDV